MSRIAGVTIRPSGIQTAGGDGMPMVEPPFSVGTASAAQPTADAPRMPAKWKASEEEEFAQLLAFTLPVSLYGSGLPSESLALRMDSTGRILRLVPPGTEAATGPLALPPNRANQEFYTLTTYFHRTTGTRAGRVVLLPLGELIVAVDAGTRKLLWSRNRLGDMAATGPVVQAGTIAWVNQPAGWYTLTFSEGLRLVKGMPLATHGRVVALATREEQATVAGNVLERLWRRRATREPMAIVIDEAHNVCPADPPDRITALATEDAIRIAGEGRKFGLYLIVVTQRPQKVHENVLSQCDNLVLMRMNSTADLAHVGRLFSFVPAGLIDRATTFSQGEALVAGKIASHPALIRFGARLSEEGGADVAGWA